MQKIMSIGLGLLLAATLISPVAAQTKSTTKAKAKEAKQEVKDTKQDMKNAKAKCADARKARREAIKKAESDFTAASAAARSTLKDALAKAPKGKDGKTARQDARTAFDKAMASARDARKAAKAAAQDAFKAAGCKDNNQ